MAIDLAKIRAKVDQLSGIKTNNNSNTKLFKPTEVGEYRIRVLPWSDTPEGVPFHERFVYYNISRQWIVIPRHLGISDPISDFIRKLFDEIRQDKSKEEENKAIAKKLFPSQVTCAAVIDRACEDDGPKLWNMNRQIAKDVTALFLNAEIGDFTDVGTSGCDLVVTVSKSTKMLPNGKALMDVKIMPARKNSAASNDPKKVEQWLSNLPKVDEFFKVTPNDEIKSRFDQWLNSGKETETSNDRLANVADAVKQPEPEKTKVAEPAKVEHVKTETKKAAPAKAASKFSEELDSAFAELEDLS
jgi:hypothetical protein